MLQPPTSSPRTDTLFPYTTLFRSFLACTIAALVGSAKDPSYRYFDVKVSGAEAKKLVQRYIGVDDPKQRPLVRFRLGDLWGDAYIRDKGDRKSTRLNSSHYCASRLPSSA